MTPNLLHIYKIGLASFVVMIICAFTKATIPRIPLTERYATALHKIPEPSDIVFDSATQHLFIVSDHGNLFECDTNGKVIRKATKGGLDFEGVEVKDNYVFVIDETPRTVYKYNKSDLSLAGTYQLSWGGAINRGYESITWNPAKNCFVLVAEQPAVIVEYTENFTELGRYHFNTTRDVSATRWHNGFMYLLSDLDHCIIKCNPNTCEPLSRYDVNIINPEGLAFGHGGKVYIASDNEQKLYIFKPLPTI